MSLLDKLDKFKKSQKNEVQEEKKIEISQKKTSPEPAKIERLIEPQIQPKKLKIGSADLDLLSKSLDRTTGFDISNVNISQDDLWLLYRLKFGKGTRVKRSVLLPQFTEAFKRNLEKMKKKKEVKI